PGLEHALRIRVAEVFVFEKLLANPTEWAGFGGTRLVCTKCIGSPRAGERQKTQQRFQCVAVLVHAGSAIQQVVRVIRSEAPTHRAARPDITLSGRGRGAELKVLVAEKLRSAPHGVDACERIATEGFGIAMGQYRPDPQVLVKVVGDSTGEEVRAWNHERGESKGGYEF